MAAAGAAVTLLAGMTGGAAMAAQAGAPAVHATGYANCTALNRDYSHGVSDQRHPRSWWIKRGATARGAYKPVLYRAVDSTMDRDHDHIACEK